MSGERWAWDQTHTFKVNVRAGANRIEHDEDDRTWRVVNVGRDRTSVLMTTDSEAAAIRFADLVCR